MNRDKWLQERRSGLGGSDAAVILAADLGYRAFRSEVELWLEKRGELPQTETPEETEIRLEFGQHNEEFVAQRYERRMHCTVHRYNKMLRHPDHPYLMANIDRLVVPPGKKIASHQGIIRTDVLLECKTVHPFAMEGWGPEGTEEIPMGYWVQVMEYLHLSVCTLAHVAALVGNSSLRVYEVRKDAELCKLIEARLVAWWKRHIIDGIPPEPESADDVALLYPRDNGQAVIATDEQAAAVAQYNAIKAQAKAIDAQKDDLGAQIRMACGPNGILLPPGADPQAKGKAAAKPIATWKASKDSQTFSLDYYLEATHPGALPEELAYLRWDILRTYTTTKPGTRRLLTKE